DLNGLHLYATTVQIQGHVINGTINFVPSPVLVQVSGNGQAIPNHEFTPDPSNATDWGVFHQNDPQVTHTFTITSAGTATLTLGTPTMPAGFVLIDAPAATLAPGQSTTMTIAMSTAAIEWPSGDVSLPTNDPNNNPFTFTVRGEVYGQIAD